MSKKNESHVGIFPAINTKCGKFVGGASRSFN
jgi:hypothetical protein